MPTAVRIPGIGVTSSLVDLGLNLDRTLQTPDQYSVAGWFTGGPVPGRPGPALIVGHVDSKK